MLKRCIAAVLAVWMVQGSAWARDPADKTRPTLPEQAAPAAHAAVAEAGPVKLTINLTAPAEGVSTTAPATLVLTADAASSQPNHPITAVRFYQGSTLLATRNQAPYSFTWSNVLAGNYALTAQAINDKGDTTTSAPVTLNVNDPPTIRFSAPQGDTRATAPANLHLIAEAADSDGSIARVEFYNGSNLLGTVTEAPYQFAWNTIPAGRYTLTARATDNQGAATTTRPILLHVNAPPHISLTTPTAGAQFVAPRPILLVADAADNDGQIQAVTFRHGTTAIGSVTEAPYMLTWNGAEPGSYAITAEATDNEGATTTTSPVAITVVPNQLPSITLAAAAQPASAPATITLTADASDADGAIHAVRFYNGTTLLATVTQPPFRHVWHEVPQGSYTLTAQAIDDLGGSTTSAVQTVTVTSGKMKVYYIQPDHLNTPRVITDKNNTVVWEWKNDDPFGNNVPDEDPDKDGQRFEFNLRFAGQYFDRETGLHYNYFRDYDPGTGRYVQSDPLGLDGGSLSTYTYANNAPTMYIDPLGLSPLAAGGATGVGGSAVGGAVAGGNRGGVGSRSGTFNPETDMYSPARASSWEDDLDFADNGPKTEYEFWRCKTDEDRDCRSRLMLLKAAYSRIKLAEMLGLNDLVAKNAYNEMAANYHRDCPYWQKVPMFTRY